MYEVLGSFSFRLEGCRRDTSVILIGRNLFNHQSEVLSCKKSCGNWDLDFSSCYLIKFLKNLNTYHPRLVSYVFSYDLTGDLPFLILAGGGIDGIDENVSVQENLIFHESRLWSKSPFQLWLCSAEKRSPGR